MSRQFDNQNVYYCPAYNHESQVYSGCLRRRADIPEGFVGPAAAFFECVDPRTGSTSVPNVWNPVYDAAVPMPAAQPAAECAPVKNCDWIWKIVSVLAGLVVLALAIALVLHLVRKHGESKEASAAETADEARLAALPAGATAGALVAAGLPQVACGKKGKWELPAPQPQPQPQPQPHHVAVAAPVAVAATAVPRQATQCVPAPGYYQPCKPSWPAAAAAPPAPAVVAPSSWKYLNPNSFVCAA